MLIVIMDMKSLQYCDGSTIAFKGWADTKNDPYTQKRWCDTQNVLDKNLSQFVDDRYAWIGKNGERLYRKDY